MTSTQCEIRTYAQMLDDEDDVSLIEEAQRRFEVGVVLEQIGTWAVTAFGLECLVEYYPIAKARLYEDEPGYGWMFHMAEKSWVEMGDFGDALQAARSYHFPQRSAPRSKKTLRVRAASVSPSLRFAILKRDGYRCQICGTTAVAGARLHVDHKHPVAFGGPSDRENLWTLCMDCNLGKGTQAL